jgi:hypothetical protein
MQTLEDVLLLAMKGEDPLVVEAMLRKRGDYRPHAAFGVDLAVPWSAGGSEEPSWEVQGAAHSRTRALPDAGACGDSAMAMVLRELSLEDDARVAAERHAGASAARPWERVGAAGWQARG